jgi:hypothetical protein
LCWTGQRQWLPLGAERGRQERQLEKLAVCHIQGEAIFRLGPQLFLDAQELVVLGGAIGARERAGLDLPAEQRCDRRVNQTRGPRLR